MGNLANAMDRTDAHPEPSAGSYGGSRPAPLDERTLDGATLLSAAASACGNVDVSDAVSPDGYSLQELVQRWRRVRERLQGRSIPRDSAKRRPTMLALLSEALALTLLSACRYRRHSFAAPQLASEYLQYAHEAQGLAEEIAAYIRSFHAEPSFQPIHLHLGLAMAGEEETLVDMVAEDLIAARVAVRSCREAVARLQTQDRRTRILFEAILAIQEQQVAGLARRYALLRSPNPGALSAGRLGA